VFYKGETKTHRYNIRLQDIRFIHSDLPHFLDTSNSHFPDTLTHTHTHTHTHTKYNVVLPNRVWLIRFKLETNRQFLLGFLLFYSRYYDIILLHGVV